MGESVIEVRGLIKDYDKLRAVNGIDLDVKAGEVYSILGPNGAGKTTSVEIMECLRIKTAGEVRILGHDIDKDQREIRKRIGVLTSGRSSTRGWAPRSSSRPCSCRTRGTPGS